MRHSLWGTIALLGLSPLFGCSKTPTKPSLGDVTSPASTTSLVTTTKTVSSITVTWNAPGNDGAVGTATSYDLRYSTSPITGGNFASASQVSGEPAPTMAGTPQSMIVVGLVASTTYYFALESSDGVPNTSALSNVAIGATLASAGDGTPPASIADLVTTTKTVSSITVNWNAPGDDGAVGTATSYDLRYSTSPITEGNFASASQVSGEPAPAVAGTAQSMIVSGLVANTTYYFALKTSDEVPNISALSNVATGTTSAGAQGSLVNGARATGEILVPGQVDRWTVDATAGDQIVVGMGETVSGSSLTPYLRIISPTGVQLGSNYGASAAGVQVKATVTGQYVVIASDGSSGFAGTGAYDITMAKSGSPVTVSSGDEGGPLVNGATYAGTLELGDLDAWTVDATAGDQIVVGMGETVSGSSLTPYLRIISPTGVQLGSNYGASAAGVQVTATVTGQYVVIASDGSGGFAGTGAYSLTSSAP